MHARAVASAAIPARQAPRRPGARRGEHAAGFYKRWQDTLNLNLKPCRAACAGPGLNCHRQSAGILQRAQQGLDEMGKTADGVLSSISKRASGKGSRAQTYSGAAAVPDQKPDADMEAAESAKGMGAGSSGG